MTKPVHASTLDMEVARRKLKRKVAAALISAMAETDADYAFMAKRLKTTPDKVEAEIGALIRGEGRSMDEVSDLALAMHVELNFGLRRYETPTRPADESKD